MPRSRISMRKTKEIFKLALQEGRSQREIAQSIGIGKTTVQDILARAKDANLEWELIQRVHEPDIVKRLFPRSDVPDVSEPDWGLVDQKMRKKGNTLALLCLDCKQEHVNGMGYSWFCQHYRAWKKEFRLTMQQHHPAGKRKFVDFSGLTLPWIDALTGQLHEAKIFVAVLGASNFTFARAVPDQSLESWLDCHVRALEFFKGVPETFAPDNLRSGVSRACRYDPDTNPSYLALAEHYGTAIIPARAYKPRDKAKVGVQFVQRWIMALLRRQSFTSIHEINNQLRVILDRANDNVMKYLGFSRRKLFEDVERLSFKAIAVERLSIPEWKIAKVSIDYHVEFERHYCRVPYRFVGKTVDVKAIHGTVEVFEGGRRIAIHPRYSGQPGRHTTKTEHMPASHKAMLSGFQRELSAGPRNQGAALLNFARRF